MAGKGRPKLDDKRDNQYRVRLNDEEDAMLDYSSRATGLPKSEIFRKALQDFYNNTLLNEYETKQQYEDVWEFDHISLKRVIKCPYCDEGNRIDFSDYIVNETSYERQMGAEIAYTFQCHDLECVCCGHKFFADGSIHEYPLGSYESEQIEIRKIFSEKSILVICQELFEKDFSMYFRKKGNFNRPSDKFQNTRMSVRFTMKFGVQFFAGVQLVFDQQSKNESY